MKTLKRGSSGEAVRLWQARMRLKPDGIFGPKTVAETKAWQKLNKLDPDGIVGPLTQQKAGFVKTKSNLYVLRIPFKSIWNADVLLSPRQHVEDFDFSYDLILNAGLFCMQSGKNTTDLVIDGKLDNGGNYTDKGLAFGTTIYPAKTSEIVGKTNIDFLGGGPTLIWDSVRYIDLKGLTLSFLSSSTQRMAFGVDDEAFYIITTGRESKCSLYTVLAEGLYQNLNTLIGGDGGGSVAMDWNGVIFTAGRPIPTVVALKLARWW